MIQENGWPTLIQTGELSPAVNMPIHPRWKSLRTEHNFYIQNGPFGVALPSAFFLDGFDIKVLLTGFIRQNVPFYYGFAYWSKDLQQPENLIYTAFQVVEEDQQLIASIRFWRCQTVLYDYANNRWEEQDLAIAKSIIGVRRDWSLTTWPDPLPPIGISPNQIIQCNIQPPLWRRFPNPDTEPPNFPWPPQYYGFWRSQVTDTS